MVIFVGKRLTPLDYAALGKNTQVIILFVSFVIISIQLAIQIHLVDQFDLI